jgi:DNA replication and repair protein RecF
MSISQLSLTNFRNLKSTTLDLHPAINLISGNNGSGKTSLLESIQVLCEACSFRTHQLKQCIAHDQFSFLLFGRFNGYKAGLSKSQNKLEIKVDGEAIKRRSTLVSRTPINIVNVESFNLVSGSPEERRRFIDWCLFHVEHTYTEHWVHFKHALKQRNRLLKNRRDLNLLDYWNDYLIEPSLAINRLRKSYTELIAKQLLEQLPELLQGMEITLDYIQGWPAEIELKQCLEGAREKDIKSGYTNYGIHRDNLQIMVDGFPATQVLSRGQLKRLCMALIVASLKIVKHKTGKNIILLIDDLHSELDSASQKTVYQQLINLGLQLFITNIEEQVPGVLREKDFKMFHVEHGMISAVKNQ